MLSVSPGFQDVRPSPLTRRLVGNRLEGDQMKSDWYMYIRVNGERIYVDPFDAKDGVYRTLDVDEQCESCGQPLGDSASVCRGVVRCRCGAGYSIEYDN